MKTMKTNLVFAVAAMTLLTAVTSCSKETSLPDVKFTSSETIPQIVVDSPNNVYDCTPQNLQPLTYGLTSSAGLLPVKLSTNVTITSCNIGDYYNGGGLGDASAHWGGYYGAKNTPYELNFECPTNTGYTFDSAVVICQSLFVGEWVDYLKYGPVESYVNFRIRGNKGTSYLSFKDPKVDTKIVQYVKGQVVSFGEIENKSKDISCLTLYKNYFEGYNYTPSVTTYDAEILPINISVDGEVITIKAFGKKRDADVSNLLKYIKSGDTVELPLLNLTEKKVQNKNFDDILTCHVLKLQ